MLRIDLKDKLITISDDKFSKPKIDSIKVIADRYGIRDILDFKLVLAQDFCGVPYQSAEVSLNKPITLEEFYSILTDLFENMEKENSEDFEDIFISIECLFIL